MRRTRQLLWMAVVLFSAALQACAPGNEPGMEEIAHYDTPGWAHDVSLDAGFLYVADRQGGYLVFDLTKDWVPAAIRTPVKDVISLAPNFSRPLLASRYEGLVLVSHEGTVLARLANGDIANAVVTRGNIAYAAYGSHGLVICRIGGGIDLISELPTPGWSHDVKLNGNLALLADWNYGLRVVDVGFARRPAEIGVLPSPATAICISVGKLGGMTGAAVAEGHGGVSLVAFSDAGRPFLLARHALGLNPADPTHPETGGWAHGVALCGEYLFVANWKRGLSVLDVRDPRRPRTIMEIPTLGTSLGVKAQAEPDGDIMVYLADGEAGLRVFRFTPN